MAKFIDDPRLHSLYDKLKYNVLGSKTKVDAHSLLTRYVPDTRTHSLMTSLINGRKYERVYDLETMKKYIADLSASKYREDAYELIGQYALQTSDPAQMRTFTRIADLKPSKPQYISMKELRQRDRENMVTRKCPHCHHKCLLPRETLYAICGYGPDGYDWEGCGRDWCFRCGRKLCKAWEQDQLYLPTNRFHDSKCCRRHSLLHGTKYPDHYCRCSTVYVCRDAI